MIHKNKVNFYKISVTIIFGLLGFFVNFQTIVFPFGEYTAAILLGLLFPMLITLSWGWKYGLLSALAGGCQSMWWLWGSSNGYAIFFVVPPFTLWVVWHGIFAELRRKQKTHKWWLSMYIVEIPFRVLSSINLLTLSRWAITLNPPSWSWASNAPNIIPLHFSIFVTIKQAIVAFVVLLLADVLLNVSYVRRFFKLKEYIDYKKTGFIISAFLLFGCLFWLIDSIFYSFAFHKESSFIDLLALDIPNYNIFIRTIFFVFCLICGLIISRILRRQKEGKIALRESEKKLFQIIDGISIATFVINKKHIVTHWNKAAENLTGVTSKEMIGTKNPWKPFYLKKRPVIADIIVNELPDKEINKYYFDKYRISSLIEGAVEVEGFFSDIGEKGKWLFISAAPLKDYNGNIIGAIETIQDITGRKQTEEALKETNKSLKEMVYIASHDLQSPLISMMGFATDFLNNYKDNLDDQGVRQLERIKVNTQRMHTLVLSLLDISRLNTKKYPYITFSAGKVVEEVLSDLSLIIERAGVKVETGKIPKIFGDKNRIEGVFRNLLNNAVTYGGKKIEIGFKDGNFFVKDDGIGIDKDQLENIFKPGEQLKDIKTEGVGMGLTFSRKVINQHNGKLWAESDGTGKGTTFYFNVKTKK